MSDSNLNATCKICGKKYHLCADCRETVSFTPWRTITDTVNCYKIFLTLNDYSNKRITKDEAREKLSELDITELNNFETNVKKTILDILKNNQPSKMVKRPSVKKEIETSEDIDHTEIQEGK